MNKEEFNRKMEEDQPVDMDLVRSVVTKSIDANLADGYPRGHRNLIIVMEELSELSQAISKQLREKGDRSNIIEEVADVLIGMEYIKQVVGIEDDEICKGMMIKIHRLQSVIEETGMFQ